MPIKPAPATTLFAIGVIDKEGNDFIGWVTAQGGWVFRDGRRGLVAARAEELNKTAQQEGRHFFVIPFDSGGL